MEPETAPQAEPAAPARRLPPKLLIAAAGSAVLLAVVGGLLFWLWPSAPAKPARHARAAAAAASAASAADGAVAHASAASASAPAAVHEPAPVAHGDAPTAPSDRHAAEAEAPTSAATLAAASAPPAVEPSHQAAPASAPAPSPDATASRQPSPEPSLDRLQRRLGEVLGARGAVDAAQPGQWRVTTRAMAVPVAAPSTAPGATAAPSALPPGHGAHGVDWSYGGQNGPQAWARLHPDFATCASGKRQSPIDIRDGLALDLEAIRFDYRPGAFSVVDNGHTVQVNVAPGSSIEILGRRFQLQQFHFHRPSEERIGGRRYEMSAHFVHKDAEGRLAVVAVMLERGAEHPLLQAVWTDLPLEQGEEQLSSRPLDPAQLLPADRRYYSYMGSLTTPPCSEGVLWLVLQQPVGVSPRQIEVFSRLYPMNARPVQRSAGRLIKQSN